MSTFLALAQAVHLRIRAGNQTPGSQPTAIPAPAGTEQAALDAIECVQEAWEWVQNEHASWMWMRGQSSFPLVAGTRTYTVLNLQASTPRYNGIIPFFATGGCYCLMYDSGAFTRVDMPITYVPYIEWRGFYDRRPRGTNAKPAFFTELPNKSLEFDPTPNAAPSGSAWQFVYDYRLTNQRMAASSDFPEAPDEYHKLIMWKAIQIFCEMRNSTGLLYQTSMMEVRNRMLQLKDDQVPVFTIDTQYA